MLTEHVIIDVASAMERAAGAIGDRTDILPFVDRRDERGASLVEYTLLIGLIVLVCIAAMSMLGSATQGPFSELSSKL